MKRILVLLFVFCALLIGARWYLVSRLDGTSRAGIRTAIDKLTADRKIVSTRTLAITEAVHRNGKSTADEVADLMADADLNRLALLYMGADWSIPRGAFLGSVHEVRALQKMEENDRIRRVGELREQLKQLERRRRIIDMRIDVKSDRHNREDEKTAINGRLLELRSSQTYREFIETDALAAKNANAKSIAEAAVVKLAAEYRKASVMRLDAILADGLAEQRAASEALDRLERALSWTDFWPLNTIVSSPSRR